MPKIQNINKAVKIVGGHGRDKNILKQNFMSLFHILKFK